MKIYAKDHPSWLEITRFIDEANQYSSYEISTVIDIGHGEFSAKNSDVHFFNAVDFQSIFDQFITNRSLVPRLEGTYNTYIEFVGKSSCVALRFNIGDAFCGSETSNFRLEGGFEVSQEILLQTSIKFSELFSIDA